MTAMPKAYHVTDDDAWAMIFVQSYQYARIPDKNLVVWDGDGKRYAGFYNLDHIRLFMKRQTITKVRVATLTDEHFETYQATGILPTVEMLTIERSV